ncbi:hypothetical protein PIB30_047885 [Stylosanthes scabra]|uniref:Uncharacterized protein n=1 Tax=Stylosanthes scabra TaxID=79078 RepID=A0ABU6YE85_9FABA|nr:hypothetical protein [Stylosanthes scabra]
MMKLPSPIPLTDFPYLNVTTTAKPKKKNGQTLSLTKFIAIVAKPDYQHPIVLPTVPARTSGPPRSSTATATVLAVRSGTTAATVPIEASVVVTIPPIRGGVLLIRISGESRRNDGFRDSNRKLALSRVVEIVNWDCCESLMATATATKIKNEEDEVLEICMGSVVIISYLARYDLIPTFVGLIAYGLYSSGLGLGGRCVTLPPLGSVGVVHSSNFDDSFSKGAFSREHSWLSFRAALSASSQKVSLSCMKVRTTFFSGSCTKLEEQETEFWTPRRPKPELRARQPMPRRGSQSLGMAKLRTSLQDHSKPTPRRGSQSLGVAKHIPSSILGATPTPRHPLIIQDPRLGARAKV